MGPGRTSTVHGCLVRQEGCGWPETTTSDKKTTAHSNMVAEQVLTYGLVDVHERQCDDSRMARGLTVLGLWLCWDLATRDLDVYRVNAVAENSSQELGVCRDP